jgi:3-oxoacyl-[acyl-carrier-protein] synthase III
VKVGLESIVSFFPETVVRREDLAYLDRFIPPGQEGFFRGADEIRRSKDDRAVEILAEGAARKALAAARLEPSDIDYIIAANIGGRRLLPMVGSHIHEKLGFPREVPATNIQNVCASFVDGLNLAWSLVLSGRYRRVLVVTVTAIATKGWGVDQTSPMAKSFGDGAGAGIVSADRLRCEFLSYDNRTFGELYEHMYMERMPRANPELNPLLGLEGDETICLAMDDWVSGWTERMGKTFAVEGIETALAKAGLTKADLDRVLIHHPMEMMHGPWIEGGVEAGIPREKWKELYNRIGNCGNVDIPASLAEFVGTGEIQPGHVVALFPPGLGGHTPCMILRWLG